ncbi:hypothetical protein J6590_105897 [Homalodisca vitripennis]|nr:hypothetical protein J6590_105897 [Homalodisca vitripennis]
MWATKYRRREDMRRSPRRRCIVANEVARIPGRRNIVAMVHKEAIDKVPNSLSSRSNIEIEIYGMEGIPPEDLKEHERHKQGKQGTMKLLSSVYVLTIRCTVCDSSFSAVNVL